MKTKLSCSILILVLSLAALPASVQANMYQNPGFEIGDSWPEDWLEVSEGDWHQSGYYIIEFGLGTARTGENNVRCGSATGDGTPNYEYFYQDITDVSGGQTYAIGGWFQDFYDGGSVAKIGIRFQFWSDVEKNTMISDETMTFTIPNDYEWHWVEGLQSAPAETVMITAMIGIAGGGVEGDYRLDDVSFDVANISNPTPPNNSSVQAPGVISLKWDHTGPWTSDVYWNAGNNDVNNVNFQYHFDNNLGTKVIQIGTAIDDPNEVEVSIAAEKNYYWRVHNGGNVGTVWHFTTVNEPPQVDAGPKQAKWLSDIGGPVSFQLAPTVNDDGLPIPPNTLTYLWTKTAGSGVVTFTPSATFKNATASMSVADDYTLKLTVSDDGAPIPGDPCDYVVLRVHANDTTGLLARYDCEEENTEYGIHDDYSGAPIDPTGSTGSSNPNYDNGTRRGERMERVGYLPGDRGQTATTMLEDGGHNDDPCTLDGTKGGIQFDGTAGHVYLANSDSDPNFNPWAPSGWEASWADLTDEVTLAAWIKVDPDTGWDNAWETIIAKGYDNSTYEGAYALWRNDNGDGVQMMVDGVGYANGTMAVNDGAWHHVMGTYDGAHICVYVDGIEDSCFETEGQISIFDAPLTVGEYYDPSNMATSAPFGGIMDEIRIHDVGLPYRSDNPEAEPLTGANARSVVSIFRTTDGHNSCGGNYDQMDFNQDCYVNFDDFVLMVTDWLSCNDVTGLDCDWETPW